MSHYYEFDDLPVMTSEGWAKFFGVSLVRPKVSLLPVSVKPVKKQPRGRFDWTKLARNLVVTWLTTTGTGIVVEVLSVWRLI